MKKTQRRQKIDVQLKHQDRDPLVLKSLPPDWKSPEASQSLAKKLVSSVEWMQKNGIDSNVKASEPKSSTRKSPLPGTVIYFSRVS